jgi:hypothetical protein
MASQVIEAELTLAGRSTEALSRFERAGRKTLGPIGEMGDVFYALALVLAGRAEEAVPFIDRASSAASAMDAASVLTAANALRAEIAGGAGKGFALPSWNTDADSVRDLLVLRAHAAGGDSQALFLLPRAAERLGMPGLAAETWH